MQWHRRLSSILDQASKMNTNLKAKNNSNIQPEEKINPKDGILDFTFH